MNEAGSDALHLLRWGLRRYRALFAACLLAGAVLAPYVAYQLTEPADAEALVVAQRLDMNISALPRYGQAVFNNGQVAEAVAAKFGPPARGGRIIPDRVSLVADQDSIVFHVIGTDSDPQTAADIANTAAGAFIQALNAPGVGVGAFTLQTPAAPPAPRGAGLSRVLAVPVGVAAGLALGLAVVSALLVARRPVIDGAAAEEATGVPSLGTVTVPRTRHGRVALPHQFRGLVPVCRHLLALPTSAVVVASRRRDTGIREQVSVAIATVLARVRDVRFMGPSRLAAMVEEHKPAANRPDPVEDGPTGGPVPLTVVESSEPLDLVQPPLSTAVVLVVPEGMAAAALRAAVVEHLGGSAEARLLMIRRGRWVRGMRSPHLHMAGQEQEFDTVGSADNAWSRR
jgi:capsular polysaccharide biosynthesis protein